MEYRVPKESDFILFLAPDTQLRIRFRHDRSVIYEFLVQLETELDGEWRPVVRYDSAQGQPHRDTIDKLGREVNKQWISGSFNDVLTSGMKDIRHNWRRYVRAFREET